MKHQRFEVGGVSLAVDSWRGGPPGFLCVHGLASNARMWDGVAAELAEMGRAVAAVDLRGHGRSGKPPAGYGFEEVCGDLEALLRALGEVLGPAWRRPVVVGQSWGANLALELAWRSPGLLAGVACVDGGTIELSRRFATWEGCAAALAPPQLAGTPATRFEAAVRSAHPNWPETGIQGSLANFEVLADGTVAPWLSLEHHLEILAGLYRHRPSTRYAELRVPVLLAPADTPGSQLSAVKRAEVGEAVLAIPQCRVAWFSPADHDLHAQFPSELAKVLAGAWDDGFFG